jgi:hypothetical protein
MTETSVIARRPNLKNLQIVFRTLAENFTPIFSISIILGSYVFLYLLCTNPNAVL